MIVYSVIGFPICGGWATFHREYKGAKMRKNNKRN